MTNKEFSDALLKLSDDLGLRPLMVVGVNEKGEITTGVAYPSMHNLASDAQNLGVFKVVQNLLIEVVRRAGIGYMEKKDKPAPAPFVAPGSSVVN